MISSPLVYTFSHNGGYTPSETTVPEFVQDLSPGLHPGRLTFRSPAVRLTFRSPAVFHAARCEPFRFHLCTTLRWHCKDSGRQNQKSSSSSTIFIVFIFINHIRMIIMVTSGVITDNRLRYQTIMIHDDASDNQLQCH